MALPFGLSWSDILPRRCCCGTTIPDTCADCDEDLVDLCYRVRRAYPTVTPDEEWPEDAESLWLHVSNVNSRCGEAFVTDQLGCRTDALEAWSFDDTPAADLGTGDWTYPDHDYYANVRRGTSDTWERVTPLGWPYKLTWNTGPSCSTVEIDMIGGVGDYAGIGEGGPPIEELSEHTLESIGSIYSSTDWPDVFRIGEWEFTKSTNCITPVAGPTCFRVIGGADERDVVCATFNPTGEPRRLDAFGDFDDTQGSCFNPGENDSFGGNLVDSTSSTTAVVWWRINTARTQVQVHVAASVVDPFGPTVLTRLDDAYAWIPYTPDWWVGGFTVGDYTVSPCTDCEAYLCYPECVVNTCPDVNASAVFITANDGATDYTASATWSDVTDEYSFSFSVGALCGTLSGRIYCDGSDIKVDFDLFDGAVHTTATFTVTWTCVGGDVSWTTPTAVSGISCALDITLWTNNS